jgi:sirohydrochlorin ferrochelatase
VAILIAHGSRVEAANDAHRQLCDRVAALTGRLVAPAFLELATPGIVDAITQAVDRGATDVVVIPYFLLPGNHTGRDIPAAVDAARAARPDATIRLARYVGDAPELVALVGDIVMRELPR